MRRCCAHRQPGQCPHKFTQWPVAGIGIGAVLQLAVKHQNRVPRAVKRQVAAEAKHAVMHRLILCGIAQDPHLRMEHSHSRRGTYSHHTLLQKAMQQIGSARHRNLTGLAKDSDAVGAALYCRQQRVLVFRQTTVRVLPAEESKCKRRSKCSQQIQRERGANGAIQLVAYRRPQGPQQLQALLRLKH